MPSAWRVHVIEARLDREGVPARVRECSLYALEGPSRDAVLDLMIAQGADPPFVLVGATVACYGDIDVEAVAVAAGRHATQREEHA